MKHRLLFIGLLSLLFASLSFNAIHSSSLEVARESMEMDSRMYKTIVSQLHERINELEN